MASITERTAKDGTTRYKAVVRKKGHPSQTATFKSKREAERWVTITEAGIMEARHFKTPEATKRTFGDMVDRYIADVVPQRHTNRLSRNAIIRHLTWWKERLGPYVIADVTPSLIVGLRDKLLNEPAVDSNGKPLIDEDGKYRRKKSPATVVRYLASLSVMYTVAVNEWEWAEENPVRRVKRPKEPRGRVRFLSDEERDRLLKACKQSPNPHLYPIVVLALSTGARQGEVLNLTWPQVDFDRNAIRLEETKNGERRTLPLVAHAHDALSEQYRRRQEGTDLVFPRPDGTKPVHIVNDWAKVLEQAQIEDFRFHDLRHSAASYLAMNGATLAEIAEILGHKTLQMVKRYAHLSDQHTAKVVERMNSAIFSPAKTEEEA